MAPAKKKQRLQVNERELPASKSQGTRSSEPVPPISILKDIVARLPSVKPPPRTDELQLRRKTYVLHGEDTFEENEPSVLHHDQAETSDDKHKRLTYVLTPFAYTCTESALMECDPGTEMTRSEMKETKIELQDSKPKKRGRKKKAVPALQEEDSTIMESENVDSKKEEESLISSVPTSGKPRKQAQKKSARSKNAKTHVTVAAQSELGLEQHAEKVEGQENENISSGGNTKKKPGKRNKKKNAD